MATTGKMHQLAQTTERKVRKSLRDSRSGLDASTIATIVKAGDFEAHLLENTEEFAKVRELRERVTADNPGMNFPEDSLDAVCDHIVILSRSTKEVLASARVQSGLRALGNSGFASSRSFDLSPFHKVISKVIEVSQVCLSQTSPNRHKIALLIWKAITQYTHQKDCRYVIGLTAIRNSDASRAMEIYNRCVTLRNAAEEWQTHPLGGREVAPHRTNVGIPPLTIPERLKTFLAVGARTCSSPAYNPEQDCTEFLTILDIKEYTPKKG